MRIELNLAAGAQALRNWVLWEPDPMRNSRADLHTRRRLLSTIAQVYERGVGTFKPCTVLKLEEVRPLALDPITVRDPGKAPRTHRPTVFSETWTVSACGTRLEWSVFDHEDGFTVSVRLS